MPRRAAMRCACATTASTRIQIKGRVVFDETKGSPRIGQLKLDGPWDETVLVLMNDDYEPCEIFAASRSAIEKALGDKAPNKRGAMTVAQFKIIARCLWRASGDLGLEAG